MSIYESSTGKWGVDWRDELGRRHRRPIGSKEAATAVETKLRETAASARQQIRNITGPAITLTEAIEIWQAHTVQSAATKAREARTLAQVSHQLANQNVSLITPQDVSGWFTGARPRYNNTTLNHQVLLLQRLFRWLHEASYIHTDVSRHLKPPKRSAAAAHILSYEEEARIMRELEPRIRLRFLLGLDAGLSVQDATDLRRSQVNLEERLIATHRHKTHAAVTIPMTRRLSELAQEQLRDLAPTARVTTSKPLRQGNTFVRTSQLQTGILWTFHDLRRTFGTRIAASHTNPLVVAALLGHRTPWPVTQLYVRPDIAMLREAIERMEEANPNTPRPATNAAEKPAAEKENKSNE